MNSFDAPPQTLAGQYLNTQENEFVSRILNLVDHFLKNRTRHRSFCVLLFPPFNPRLRFLTHTFIQESFEDYGVKTISVGNDSSRSTVVYVMSDLTKTPNTTVKTDAGASKVDIEESWDDLFDDNGECTKPELVKEFKNVLSLDDATPLKVVVPNDDFEDFTSSSADDLTDHEYPHVLEVYDFPPELTTQDLITRIMTAGTPDFSIVWVNDTHALAIFRSQMAANTALRTVFPDLKVRVLSQASPDSRLKARQSTDKLLPPRKRPQTSMDAARRLVGRHLGLKVEVSSEQRRQERLALQEAKDKKRQLKKLSNDVWEGNVN